MKSYYSVRSKSPYEGDIFVVGSAKLRVLKCCGDVSTANSERLARTFADEFFESEYFYGTSQHCYLHANSKLFACVRL